MCTLIMICDLSDISPVVQVRLLNFPKKKKKTANGTLELIFLMRLLANNNQYLKIMADCTWPTGPLFKDHHPVNSFQGLGEVEKSLKNTLRDFTVIRCCRAFQRKCRQRTMDLFFADEMLMEREYNRSVKYGDPGYMWGGLLAKASHPWGPDENDSLHEFCLGDVCEVQNYAAKDA